MRLDDPNLPQLRIIATALGELREQLVFVGGSVTGLLITDPLATGIRATKDVDTIADADRVAFRQMESRVAKSGFDRDFDGGVTCRWIHRESGLLLDLMPVAPEVLGFSNRWYPYTVATADTVNLGDGLSIRVANAVGFVATKLEAFTDRGSGDIPASHDLEDLLAVVDGRVELAEELSRAPESLRRALAEAFAALLDHPDFRNVLPGLISEPERADIVIERLQRMST